MAFIVSSLYRIYIQVFHINVRTLCKSLSWNVHNIQVYTNGLNTNLFFDYCFNSMRMEKKPKKPFSHLQGLHLLNPIKGNHCFHCTLFLGNSQLLKWHYYKVKIPIVKFTKFDLNIIARFLYPTFKKYFNMLFIFLVS